MPALAADPAIQMAHLQQVAPPAVAESNPTPLATTGCILSAAPTFSGQPDFTANHENRWKAVTHDTLYWPYGMYWHHGTVTRWPSPMRE